MLGPRLSQGKVHGVLLPWLWEHDDHDGVVVLSQDWSGRVTDITFSGLGEREATPALRSPTGGTVTSRSSPSLSSCLLSHLLRGEEHPLGTLSGGVSVPQITRLSVLV